MGKQVIGKLNDSLINDKSMINEVSQRETSMINESMIIDRRGKISKTDMIADRLVKKFGAPQSRRFFLKCAWHLSEAEIWDIAEASMSKKIQNHTAYFVRSCQNRLRNS